VYFTSFVIVGSASPTLLNKPKHGGFTVSNTYEQQIKLKQTLTAKSRFPKKKVKHYDWGALDAFSKVQYRFVSELPQTRLCISTG
jgi:hypothetical protein